MDAAEIEAQGRAAVRAIVGKQIETGLDVIDDGEQSRESFVLYMRHRLTGLGGVGSRPMHADLDAYPQYKADVPEPHHRPTGSPIARICRRRSAPIGYADPAADRGRMRRIPRGAGGAGGRFAEAFLTAPSPGIIAAIVQNEHYDTFERYLDALAAALQVEYEAIVAHGFLLQLDCPDLALERHTSYRDRPLADFVDFVEMVVAAINKALRNIPRERIRLHVCWGNYEGPHDRDVALSDILPGDPEGESGRDLPALRQSAPRARVPGARGRSRSAPTSCSSPASSTR